MTRLATIHAGVLALGIAGCTTVPRPSPLPAASTSAKRPAAVTAAIERARLAPRDAGAQKAAGLALMWHTLSGDLSSHAQAEAFLEAAFALDPFDAELARSLARFYNLRAVAGDPSRASAQVRVYEALLGRDPDPLTLPDEQFVAWSFSRMGAALAAAYEGDELRGLVIVRRLERSLQKRTRMEPSNVELRALAGNFALFFAGNLPLGKKRRVQTGAEHFEFVHENWGNMRPGAATPPHCPNTWHNFTFELAEAQLALGEVKRARELYEELSEAPDTGRPAAEIIARVARGRLNQVDELAGDLNLLPPWPSDAENCVVCHATTAEITPRTLYRPPRVIFSDETPGPARVHGP